MEGSDVHLPEGSRPIQGFQGRYYIDTLGNVYRLYRQFIRQHKTQIRNGRLVVWLTLPGGKKRAYPVHLLVANAYLGPRPKGYVVYHRNGDRADPALYNLAVISRRELGKRTGHMARRRPVAKIDPTTGETVDFYRSATQAARLNHISPRAMFDHIIKKTKAPTVPGAIAQTPAGDTVKKWSSPTISYSWPASTDEDGDTVTYLVELSLDGGAFSQVDSTTDTAYVHTIGSEDSVQLRVRATDGKEHSAYSTGPVATILHNSVPSAPGAILQTPDGATVYSWAASTITYTWQASVDEDGDAVTYEVERSLNGGAWEQAATTDESTYLYSISQGDTSVQIRVRATDGKDHSDYSTGGVAIIEWDTTPPVIASSVSPLGFTREDVSITLTLTDAQSGLASLQVPPGLDGYPESTTLNLSGSNDELTFTAPANGSFTFVVTDAVGNEAQLPVEVANIDRTPPVIESISLQPTGAGLIRAASSNASNEQLQVVLQYSDTPDGNDAESGVATFSYRLLNRQGEVVADWVTSPIGSLPVLSERFTGTMEYYITDFAGNHSYERTGSGGGGSGGEDGGKLPISLDDDPPALSYVLDNSSHTNQAVVATVYGNDPDSGMSHFIVEDTGARFEGGSMSYIFPENGQITVTGYDEAGNSETIIITVDNIDLTPPEVSGLSADEADREDVYSPVTITISAQDIDLGHGYSGMFGIRLHDGSVIGGDSATITVAENGAYTFTALDNAGNETPTSWTVDSIQDRPTGGSGGSSGGGSGSSGGKASVDPPTVPGGFNPGLNDELDEENDAEDMEGLEEPDGEATGAADPDGQGGTGHPGTQPFGGGSHDNPNTGRAPRAARITRVPDGIVFKRRKKRI